MLDKASEKILKFASNPSGKAMDFNSPELYDFCRELEADNYIEIVYGANNAIESISLTPKGKRYFEIRVRERIRFWVPVGISGIALLIAIASLAVDILQLIS